MLNNFKPEHIAHDSTAPIYQVSILKEELKEGLYLMEAKDIKYMNRSSMSR